jgi:hypothetical protein
MNIKKYKLLALFGVGLITALTTSPTLKDLNAALTAPASWTFKYTNQDFPGYKIRSQTAVVATPAYTRTADGIYYNYTNTSTITTGLTVQQTFNRSNTTWYDNAGTWIPNDTKIGSTNGVGTVSDKVYLNFNNQTNKNYYLYIDVSSVADAHYNFYRIDNNIVGGIFQTTELGFLFTSSRLNTLYIPSYSQVQINTTPSVSSQRYIDAWYLLDLGVSDAYDAGVDAGYIQGQDDADLLVTGFQAMVGILVNFALMIANLEVFGISLMGIFAIVVLFAGIVWTLKLIRG